MDDDGCSIAMYGTDWTEERWWQELASSRTEQTFREKHVPQRWAPKDFRDCDKPAQPPMPLDPLEHGPGPLLDASEA